MSSKRSNKNDEDIPEGRQMFRYWVDHRDLRDGSTRALPLHTVVRIHIPTKKSEQQRPGEEFLRLEDGATTLEAENFDDLVTQLRRKYPDEAYERTLRRGRDFHAEHAMNDFIKLLARAAAEKLVRERGEVARPD